MRFNLKNHNCFWVYQNKTFFEEANGGFLWSPKYAKDGKKNPGYEAMKEVHKGDIILHSYMGRIVAISKAKDAAISVANALRRSRRAVGVMTSTAGPNESRAEMKSLVSATLRVKVPGAASRCEGCKGRWRR